MKLKAKRLPPVVSMSISPKSALKGIVHMCTKLDETPAFCGAALPAGCAGGPTAAVGGNASGAWLTPGVGGIYCVESGAGGSFPYWVGAVAGFIEGAMDLVSSIACWLYCRTGGNLKRSSAL